MSDIAPELVVSMEQLVRAMAEHEMFVSPAQHGKAVCDDYWRAKMIAAALPEPVDPDLIEARNICHDVISIGVPDNTGAYVRGELDGSLSMRAAVAAIKRGRELAGGAA